MHHHIKCSTSIIGVLTEARDPEPVTESAINGYLATNKLATFAANEGSGLSTWPYI